MRLRLTTVAANRLRFCLAKHGCKAVRVLRPVKAMVVFLSRECIKSMCGSKLPALSTDWEHDKFAGYGAYTHYAVPLKDGAKAVSIIRDGMGKERNIWFAGEHTAPDIVLSTIVGAYWSGERVAKEIMACSGVMEYYEDKLQHGMKPDL
jgi:Flavin containing amine oxidoreductase